MHQRLQKLFEWYQRHAKTLDLLGEYARAVYARWNDYLWGELAVAPVVIWWIFGSPPVWVTVPAFFWAFLIAGYYVWRKEYLKNLSDDFKCYLYDAATQSSATAELLGDHTTRVFIGLRIVNVGPQASIHTWQAGYKSPNERHGIVLTDGVLVEGSVGRVPESIRGDNLRGDYRVLTTGETRVGWIAFDVYEKDLEAADWSRLLDSVSLGFTDAFDKFHEGSWLPTWAKKLN